MNDKTEWPTHSRDEIYEMIDHWDAKKLFPKFPDFNGGDVFDILNARWMDAIYEDRRLKVLLRREVIPYEKILIVFANALAKRAYNIFGSFKWPDEDYWFDLIMGDPCPEKCQINEAGKMAEILFNHGTTSDYYIGGLIENAMDRTDPHWPRNCLVGAHGAAIHYEPYSNEREAVEIAIEIALIKKLLKNAST